jgi:hypothetical protein
LLKNIFMPGSRSQHGRTFRRIDSKGRPNFDNVAIVKSELGTEIALKTLGPRKCTLKKSGHSRLVKDGGFSNADEKMVYGNLDTPDKVRVAMRAARLKKTGR